MNEIRKDVGVVIQFFNVLSRKWQNCRMPMAEQEKTIKKRILKILFFIWAAVDSNHRPHPYQGCALTT